MLQKVPTAQNRHRCKDGSSFHICIIFKGQQGATLLLKKVISVWIHSDFDNKHSQISQLLEP